MVVRWREWLGKRGHILKRVNKYLLSPKHIFKYKKIARITT